MRVKFTEQDYQSKAFCTAKPKTSPLSTVKVKVLEINNQKLRCHCCGSSNSKHLSYLHLHRLCADLKENSSFDYYWKIIKPKTKQNTTIAQLLSGGCHVDVTVMR